MDEIHRHLFLDPFLQSLDPYHVRAAKEAERELTAEYGNLEYSLKEKIGILDIGLTLDDFICVEKPDSIENVNNEKKSLEERRLKLNKQLSEAQEILNIEKPQIIERVESPLFIIDEIKKVLDRKFKDLDETIYEKFKTHINKHIKNKDGNEEGWIKLGVSSYLDNKLNSNCPFCGQQLKNAEELIKIYRAIFSEEYKNYYSDIENRLSALLQELENYAQKLDKTLDIFKINLIIIQKYEKYLEESEIDLIKKIINHELEKKIKELLVIHQQQKSIFVKLIEQKFRRPFESIKLGIGNNIFTLFESSVISLNSYNNFIENILDTINKLHSNLKNPEILKKDFLQLDNKIRKCEILTKRYELSSDIEKLLFLRKQKEDRVRKRESKQTELEQKINRFTDEYFNKTTETLKDLGSFDFEIGKFLTKRGDQPVFEPIIKFKGKEVTNELLPFVFSDADRRALAFSFFLSKINKKTDNELKQTIIVLDDPVTSFDDDRIDQTIIKIQELIEKNKQIIILAHHSNFLKQLYGTLKKNDKLEMLF